METRNRNQKGKLKQYELEPRRPIPMETKTAEIKTLSSTVSKTHDNPKQEYRITP